MHAVTHVLPIGIPAHDALAVLLVTGVGIEAQLVAERDKEKEMKDVSIQKVNLHVI